MGDGDVDGDGTAARCRPAFITADDRPLFSETRVAVAELLLATYTEAVATTTAVFLPSPPTWAPPPLLRPLPLPAFARIAGPGPGPSLRSSQTAVMAVGADASPDTRPEKPDFRRLT